MDRSIRVVSNCRFIAASLSEPSIYETSQKKFVHQRGNERERAREFAEKRMSRDNDVITKLDISCC